MLLVSALDTTVQNLLLYKKVVSKAVVENFSFSVVKTEKVIKLKIFLLRVEPKFFAVAFLMLEVDQQFA